MPSDDLNRQAIAALDKEDCAEAQRLFRQNARENPCLEAFNNLGFFYKEYGLRLPGGKARNADALGLAYLLKASECGMEYKNRMALGYCFLLKGDDRTAERYYADALSANPRHEALYNLGLAQYRQEKYSEALSLFQSADKGPMPGDEDGDYRRCVHNGIIFCHYCLGKEERALQLLSSLDEAEIWSELGMEAFALAYRCGRLAYARELCLKAEENRWTYSIPQLAMIMDCFFKLGLPDAAQERLRDYFENHEWMSAKEARTLKRKFLDPVGRAKLIESHRFQLPILHLCYYIGCPEHPDGGYGKTPTQTT